MGGARHDWPMQESRRAEKDSRCGCLRGRVVCGDPLVYFAERWYAQMSDELQCGDIHGDDFQMVHCQYAPYDSTRIDDGFIGHFFCSVSHRQDARHIRHG